MLGELTDELAEFGVGTYVSFVFEVKNSTFTATLNLAVKIIRLNYTNSQKINYKSIRDIVQGSVGAIVLSSTAI